MSFTPFETLCLCATIAIVPLVLGLLGRVQRQHLSNRLLLAILLVNLALLLRAALMLRGLLPGSIMPWVSLLGLAAFWLLPPLLYLYSVQLLWKPAVSSREMWAHVVPAVVIFAVLAGAYWWRTQSDLGAYAVTRTSFLMHQVALQIQCLGYVVAVVRRAHIHAAQIDQAHLRWVVLVLVMFGVHWGFSASSGLLSLTATPRGVLLALESCSIVTLLAFCCVASFYGIRRLPTIAQPERNEKYAGSTLSGAALVDHAKRIEAYLQAQRPYTDPSFSAQSLASAVGLTPRQLSQVLNDGMKQRFADLVNRYRVTEAQRLLADPLHAQTAMLDLLYEAGFRSKSAFNRVFKSVTGQTPSAYRQSVLANGPVASSTAGPSPIS